VRGECITEHLRFLDGLLGKAAGVNFVEREM
jgi:hypothetical protein